MNAFDALTERYRERIIRPSERRILISRIEGTEQENDLTVPPNADGLGRIRHFRVATSERWVPNPLPVAPAAAALQLGDPAMIRAQVFQNAACNWRCWYCFVPFQLLSGDQRRGRWVTAEDLVELYMAMEDRPEVIDLSGGEPNLTPEWVPWMMQALTERGLSKSTYLWSDDNLSTDYLWQYLDDDELEAISSYERYGRVGCFKGFDAQSFSFNTGSDGALFDRQFELFGRLQALGIDLYAYATFTSPRSEREIGDGVAGFVDRLQTLGELLPLRTVPLEVSVFAPVSGRLNDSRIDALSRGQFVAIEAWKKELESRFSTSQRETPIHQVSSALGR